MKSKIIFTHKTDFMRTVLKYVANEYVFFTTGTVEPKKAKALSLKFSDRYHTDMTVKQRYRNKRKGNANTNVLMWFDGTLIHWILLCTKGEGLVFQMEKLLDATHKKSRITVTGYELVKTPRENDKPTWSWRIEKGTYNLLEQRIKKAIRLNDTEQLSVAMYSLQRTIGFSESRKQAYALYKYAKSEWVRSRKGDFPYKPIFVNWVGRYKIGEKITFCESIKIN